MKVFITGGAGFIGTRLIKKLKEQGVGEIGVLDNLHPQVHGEDAKPPAALAGTEFVKADIRDEAAVNAFVARFQPTHVVHLAAETGTGQSMDEILRYCQVNVDGTAILIQALNKLAKPIERIVLASSRAVYGEGPWKDGNGNIVTAPSRLKREMDQRKFTPALNGSHLNKGMPATEDRPADPKSVYASTKLMQEYLILQSRLKPTSVILRFQNVYGPGQSLRNPYTGVLSIFCSQLLAGQTLNIYEDGEIIRDFVFVDDIVDGIAQALRTPTANGEIINLGSGEETSILSAAQGLCDLFKLPAEQRLKITGQFREGDIRFACAEISKAKQIMGWTPKVSFKSGLGQLARWSAGETSL